MAEGYNFTTALKIHESIYNSSFHNTIKTSPNEVHFGRKLPNILDTFTLEIYQNRLDIHSDYYNLANNLQKFYDQVHSNLLYHQEIQNLK